MKKNSQILFLVMCVSFFLPTIASAAPSLVGIWKGTVRKVTTTACPAPVVATLTLSQCMVGVNPGNLFNGTIKVGADIFNIVGKISTFTTNIGPGFPSAFKATGKNSTGLIKEVVMAGVYVAATATSPASIQISEFQILPSGSSIPSEMYDAIVLKK